MFHWYCGLGLGNNPDTCSNHNYYIYEGDYWDRLWLVPWDLDLSFGSGGGFVSIPTAWNDPNPDCSGSGGGGFGFPGGGQALPPACDKLTQGWAEFGDEYAAAVRMFVDGPFNAANVNAKLDAWAAQIAPAVQEASDIGHSPSPNSWQSELQSLRSLIDRQRSVMSGVGN